MSTLVIIGIAILGSAAAIAAFLRYPPESRYRIPQSNYLEEQLKACPENAQAVIVKGNKKRALIKAAPFIFIAALWAGFALWIKNAEHPECVRLIDINAAYISLLLTLYALPIASLVVSVLFLGTGIRTIRTGYFPPLDSVVFNDTIAKKGYFSTLRGVVLLVLPIFTGYLVYFGNDVYTQFFMGKSIHEIVEKLEAKCP